LLGLGRHFRPLDRLHHVARVMAADRKAGKGGPGSQHQAGVTRHGMTASDPPRAALFIGVHGAQCHVGLGLPETFLLGRYYELRQLSAAGKIGIDVKVRVRKRRGMRSAPLIAPAMQAEGPETEAGPRGARDRPSGSPAPLR
jgi:hypothetical protein